MSVAPMRHPRIKLVSFNPDSSEEVAHLRYQRILCGWGVSDVDTWCAQCRKGDKYLFWIVPIDPTAFTLPPIQQLSLKNIEGPVNPTPGFLPLGTISADWIDYKGDESLCDRSQNRACVATFFLLKSLHSVGLGTETMDLFERTVAKDPYNVKELTLNTLSAASAMSAEFWENLGIVYSPTARINEHWYKSRDYVAYKNAPRYEEKTIHGDVIMLEAVYMKKDLTKLT